MEAQSNYKLSPLRCGAINSQLSDQVLDLKLFGNHEGKHVSSQLLVLWAINLLLITLADEEAEW